ncbi:hypothetical protein SAMN05444000_104194 [Shimia gijangensis]|uniref:Excalibur calcium-binding domain-containing protein n=1 Tax=Shimia gijangensis TaxID=1470563 RepID=A0A1M6FXU8_9RHOB|nr:hypothetical protein [Shimia gijangensis]SHJ02516.1 hypothetical protein SAMN05444000_104194 [Shimia gijangensis]
MRSFVIGCALVALAACQPKIPDSAAGVGFDNAVLKPVPQQATTTSAIPPATAVSEETLGSSTASTTAAAQPKPQTATQPMATTTTAAVASGTTSSSTAEPPVPTRSSASAPQTTAAGVVHASPDNPAPVQMNNPGISDENNFASVGSRRTIEDDAERIATNKANYQVITPTALPTRTSSGPNVVAFALSTNHAVGTKAYSRIGLTSQSRHQKACAKYASESDAQSAFLSKGGPKKDRLGLDPDGDGYACKWDPTPFRQATSN